MKITQQFQAVFHKLSVVNFARIYVFWSQIHVNSDIILIFNKIRKFFEFERVKWNKIGKFV